MVSFKSNFDICQTDQICCRACTCCTAKDFHLYTSAPEQRQAKRPILPFPSLNSEIPSKAKLLRTLDHCWKNSFYCTDLVSTFTKPVQFTDLGFKNWMVVHASILIRSNSLLRHSHIRLCCRSPRYTNDYSHKNRPGSNLPYRCNDFERKDHGRTGDCHAVRNL